MHGHLLSSYWTITRNIMMLNKKSQLVSELQLNGVELENNNLPSSISMRDLENKYQHLIAGGYTKTYADGEFFKQTHGKIDTPFGSID